MGKQIPSPLPPVIKDERNEPLMKSRLSALAKRMAELHETRLKVCHYVEGFHLR
jgi:hypothetical protein